MVSIPNSIGKFRSGVFAVTFMRDNKLVASGSGFVYKGKLVSNNHVFNPNGSPFPDDTIVSFRFGDSSKYENDARRLKYSDLGLIVGSHESSNDYAVYESPMDLNDRYNFELSNEVPEEGSLIMFMGYPFNAKFMTTHVGYISALYSEANVDYIQLDASINSGNSGGPLLNPASGKVIGIVTRKQTGLSEEFDDLLKSFDQNIHALEGVKGMIGMAGIDPIHALQASQTQMKGISESIKRSSNTGIGYAFGCKSLAQEDI